MKVAIYTIALNEEQFVEKWYESAKEADYLLIADTGRIPAEFEQFMLRLDPDDAPRLKTRKKDATLL